LPNPATDSVRLFRKGPVDAFDISSPTSPFQGFGEDPRLSAPMVDYATYVAIAGNCDEIILCHCEGETRQSNPKIIERRRPLAVKARGLAMTGDLWFFDLRPAN
jgi:hypothetical protein